jgi:hypothetical protein
VKGKEKQTVGELYDLFESVGRRISMISDQTLIKLYLFFSFFL